jgi:hypothetical protein
MNIFYKGKVYFFKNDSFERNILYIKLVEQNIAKEDINNYINLYFSKQKGCTYSPHTEEKIKQLF